MLLLHYVQNIKAGNLSTSCPAALLLLCVMKGLQMQFQITIFFISQE